MKRVKLVYRIGDWVHVKAYARRNDLGRINSDPYVNPRLGQVVGITKIQQGHAEYLGSGQGSVFVQTGRPVIVWLVRFGLANKEVRVLEEDLELTTYPNAMGQTLPYIYAPQSPWDERARSEQRSETAKIPRDAKGHWLKSGLTSGVEQG